MTSSELIAASPVKRLFIIDVMAMVFRHHHAFEMNPLKTTSGFPTSSLFGSAKFITNLIKKETPDYLVLATDTKAPTFRHKLFPDYKAHRVEMPEEIATQLPKLFEMFTAWDLPLLSLSGYEADDIIGTLVKKFSSTRLHSYIVSGDKDFWQLISPCIFSYNPDPKGSWDVMDTQGVQTKLGCTPQQVIDYLAICGDRADNIPGVFGLGPKTAQKLLGEHLNLDNIYNNLSSISSATVRNKLQNQKDQAFLSKELVTIKTDLDLAINLSNLSLSNVARNGSNELIDIFEEFEFRALAANLRNHMASSKNKPGTGISTTKSGEPTSSIPKPLIPKAPATTKNYTLIHTQSRLNTFLEDMSQSTIFAFDVETTGLDIITDQPIGISFSLKKGQGYYLPLIEKHLKDLCPEDIIEKVRGILTDPNKAKLAHNLKFDIQMLQNISIDPEPPFEDSMIAAFVANSNRSSYSLDALSLDILGIEKTPIESLIGNGGKKGAIRPMDQVPIEHLVNYGCEDTDCCLQLFEHFSNILADNKIQKLYQDIEIPLIPILAKMEKNGIRLDTDHLEKLGKDLGKNIARSANKIYSLSEEEFNINSPKQLQYILFEKKSIHKQLNISNIKKTKSGLSTDVSVLQLLSKHPLAQELLNYRVLTKLKSTYVDSLPKMVHPKTSRVHTNFHQTGTATGRLSSSNPNLQTIPIRSADGKIVRAAFSCKPGSKILCADYSQIELRVLAHLANDTSLIDAFASGLDIHQATAARMFGVKTDAVTSDLRSRAKAINYGVIYGMGPQRLAQSTGVSLSEAKEFIAEYFNSFPGIKIYIKSAVAFAKKHGYSETICGRKRDIGGLTDHSLSSSLNAATAQNIAVNSPIQGSTADLMKLAMISVDKRIMSENLDAKMLLQVHDELVFEVSDIDLKKTSEMVKYEMENVMHLKVNLKVDVGYGHDWLEAH